MTDAHKTQRIWTPANVITFLRICLVPIFVVALLSPWPEWFGMLDVITDQAKALVAAGVFIFISCTDWIDGYLARSRGEVTDLGKFLDPLADKILVAAALIALVELRVIPSWPVLIILTREFIVSGIRMLAATKGVVIAASWYGKAKTVLQIVAIVLFLVKDSLYVPDIQSVVDQPLYIISWLVMLAALVMTVISMFDYIIKARPLLFPKASDTVSQSNLRESSTSVTEAKVTKRIDGISDAESLARDVIELASEKELTIATAESLTGGLISALLTSVPGSSAVVCGGFVTYTNAAKSESLGVGKLLLQQEGAVCEEVAIEMAEGAQRRLGADISVSVTGIAGPSGAEPGKPVGTVCFGFCTEGIASSSTVLFDGDRDSVRLQTACFALDGLKSRLSEL